MFIFCTVLEFFLEPLFSLCGTLGFCEYHLVNGTIVLRLNSQLFIYGGKLSSPLLSKSMKIKTCRTIILPVVLHGCETWLTEENRLRGFETGVIRKIVGPKGGEVKEAEANCIMKSLIIFTFTKCY